MKQVLFCALTVVSVYTAAFSVTRAQAQPTHVFVAAQGTDSANCTFAAPCRSFQKAHDTVAAGGEIDVLDPAGYVAAKCRRWARKRHGRALRLEEIQTLSWP